MLKTHTPYSPEFRRQMVDLVRSGRDPTDLAREFEPSSQAIRKWVVQADRQDGRREEKAAVADPGLTAAEREGLARLRREDKQLRVERDILSRPSFRCPPWPAFCGSKAGYYAWLARAPSAHAEADAALLKRVHTIHVSSRQTYGAPRVHAELRARDERHGRKRIARLMREAGLVGASINIALPSSVVSRSTRCGGWADRRRPHRDLSHRSVSTSAVCFRPLAWETA